MKKSKIFRTLAVFGTCLSAPLLLTGCMKESQSKVSFRVEDGYISNRRWNNLEKFS